MRGREDPRERLSAFGTELIEIHRWLRRELAQVRGDVERHLDGRGSLPKELKAHCLAFCSALSKHHAGEDSGAFPVLARKYPDLRPVIGTMGEDHQVVAGLLRQLDQALAGIAAEDAAGARRLLGELDGLTAILESHFSFEERRIVTALDSLSAADATTRALFGIGPHAASTGSTRWQGGLVGGTLARRALAEVLGTGLLVTAVVGSGIAAAKLSPGDVGLQLLENATATAFALGVLILVFGPVSGAHFNPVVSLVDWWVGRRERAGLKPVELGVYAGAQVVGAIGGAVLANLMFDRAAVSWSTTDRAAGHLWLGEVVATAGLILLIFALARSGRATTAPAAIGAYIGAAYWFTSSTSFANPAVTVGRAFSDTFAGITPASLPGFVLAQLAGATVATGLLLMLYPGVARTADEVVVPQEHGHARPDGTQPRVGAAQEV